MTPNAPPDRQIDYQPTAEEVRDLLRRAARHPLGTEFLRDGSLDAVAATFGVHAFCVDAARDTLRQEALALR